MSESTADFSEWVMEGFDAIQKRLTVLEEASASGQASMPTLWPTPAPDLVEWVEGWLVPTFDMTFDVQGWQDIPAVVSELSALWIGYNTMTGPQASGFDPLVWHSHLASARTRMAEYSKRARHRETQLETWRS